MALGGKDSLVAKGFRPVYDWPVLDDNGKLTGWTTIEAAEMEAIYQLSNGQIYVPWGGAYRSNLTFGEVAKQHGMNIDLTKVSAAAKSDPLGLNSMGKPITADQPAHLRVYSTSQPKLNQGPNFTTPGGVQPAKPGMVDPGLVTGLNDWLGPVTKPIGPHSVTNIRSIFEKPKRIEYTPDSPKQKALEKYKTEEP